MKVPLLRIIPVTAIGLALVAMGVGAKAVKADEPVFRGRALIVGVNNYQDENINDLEYSVADAHLLFNRLTDASSGVFAANQVRLLADDGNTKPTRAAILKGVEWLSQAAPDETVLLYFSGHGTIEGKEQYLVPADTELTAVPDTAVSVSRLNAILDDPARTLARRVVVIFDSCHSGVRRGGKALSRGTSESGAVIESLMTEAEGRVTLSSCNADEESFEDPEKKHGVFTYFLNEGLKGAADSNTDGLVGVGELHVYVRRAVTEWARGSGHSQTPRVQMNVSGEIVLSRDVVKFHAAQAQQKQQLNELKKLRDEVLARIGAENLSSSLATPLLAAFDRLLSGRIVAGDQQRADLARRWKDGALPPAALAAELGALGTIEDGPQSSAEALPFTGGKESDTIKLQLFQPQAQEVEDGFTVDCVAGADVKIVGLAQSPGGVTRVMLGSRELLAGSLDARSLKIVKSEAPADLKFEGSLRAGNAPSTTALTVIDAAGNYRTFRLHLKPTAGADAPLLEAAARKPVIAVIGLNKKAEIDTYTDLQPLRIGMGLTEQLINVARDSNRCTLVNGDSEVLKSIIEMQWQQQEAAFDKAQAVRMGRLVGARFVLYGVIYYFALPSENDGELSMKIQLKLVDVETGLLYPGSGEGTLTTPSKQTNGREFSKKDLDQVASSAMNSALKDLWNYMARQGVLPPQTPPVVPVATPSVRIPPVVLVGANR